MAHMFDVPQEGVRSMGSVSQCVSVWQPSDPRRVEIQETSNIVVAHAKCIATESVNGLYDLLRVINSPLL